jgi:lysophospholipase L1-like esterase
LRPFLCSREATGAIAHRVEPPARSSLLAVLPCGSLAGADGLWTATWSASLAPPVASDSRFANQTLRQIARISVGGDEVRVRISNEHGTRPLVIGAAHVAIAGAGAAIRPGTDRVLTFSGRGSVVVPPGKRVVSDPAELRVAALERLAVSLHFPSPTGPATLHRYAQQTAYVSRPGDFTGRASLPVADTSGSWFYLSGVEVGAPRAKPVIVALGDSLPDGFGSTVNANRRWPDRLAERLAGRRGMPPLGVVNAGYFGNRLLHEAVLPAPGVIGRVPSVLRRFGRDVLAQPGARYVIVQAGINDIGLPGLLGRPGEAVTAAEIIAAYRRLIARAHARGLEIFGGTLTPFVGATYGGYGTPEGEAKRQAVNRWIRTSGAFDAVIDFDAAVRDPRRPERLNPRYDSGDHLHLNDAGYRAMADAIDLRLFAPGGRAAPG